MHFTSEPHEHQWNWIDTDAQRCIKCGLTAEAHIAALEAENAELRFGREAAEDEIIAGREHLNIAGQEIDALTAENARMRAVVEAVANMPMPFDDSWDDWTCPFCPYTEDVNNDEPSVPHAAECPVASASAILASASALKETSAT